MLGLVDHFLLLLVLVVLLDELLKVFIVLLHIGALGLLLCAVVLRRQVEVLLGDLFLKAVARLRLAVNNLLLALDNCELLLRLHWRQLCRDLRRLVLGMGLLDLLLDRLYVLA